MAIHYVDPVNGNDSTGDGKTPATAWATYAKADGEASTGDEVRLMNTAPEALVASITMQTTGVYFVGADGDGNPLTGNDRYVIDAAGLASGSSIVGAAGIVQYWKNIHLTGIAQVAPDNGFYSNYSNNSLIAYNCRIDRHTGSGARLDTSSAGFIGFYCEIDNNLEAGLRHDREGTRGLIVLRGCKVHSNGGDGIKTGVNTSSIIGCLVYGNAGNGIISTGYASIVGNTVYNNGENGIWVGDEDDIRLTVCFNSCVDNGDYGIYIDGTTQHPLFNMYNHTHDNEDGASNVTMPGYGHVTGDPKFVDAAGGDFRPTDGSPLLLPDGRVIGALSPSAVANGNGGPAIFPFENPYIR